MKHKLNRPIALASLCVFISILTPTYAADSNARDVADKLNKLYQRTKPCENNKAAFYCSGIIIHGSELDETSGWYLSPDRAVGSFSYLRMDITPHVGYPIFSSVGYILTPLSEVEENKQYQYPVYCEYASDAMTDGGVESSCGFGSSTDANKSDVNTCLSKGIETLPEFLKAYAGKIKLTEEERKDFRQEYGEEKFEKIENSITLNDQCSFSPDEKSFEIAMQIHKYAYRDHPDTLGCSFTYNIMGDLDYCNDNNELILGSWKQTEVGINQVPIAAFFFEINDAHDSESDIAKTKAAFKVSDDYSKATHYARRIPVVTIDMAKLKSGSGDIFAPAVRP